MPSRPSWYSTSYRPDADDSSARCNTATGHAASPQFDATSEWTPSTGFKPHRLRCFCTNVWAPALTTDLFPTDDDAIHTGHGNLADDRYPDPYNFTGEASFFIVVDIVIYIFETGQKDGQEAPQKGAISEGQKEQEEETQQEINAKKV